MKFPITLFLMEEVLFFQFFEKMKPFREKFVMTKFEEHKKFPFFSYN